MHYRVAPAFSPRMGPFDDPALGYVIDFVYTSYTEAADSSGRSSPKKRIHTTGVPLRRTVRRVIMASIQ